MAAGYGAYNCSARAFVVHGAESVPTFSFLSSWQEVLTDFEMACLTVKEKNMVLSVLDFFEQEKGRKSLINVSDVVRWFSEVCLVSESTITSYRKDPDQDIGLKGWRPKLIIDELRFTLTCIRSSPAKRQKSFGGGGQRPFSIQVLTVG